MVAAVNLESYEAPDFSGIFTMLGRMRNLPPTIHTWDAVVRAYSLRRSTAASGEKFTYYRSKITDRTERVEL